MSRPTKLNADTQRQIIDALSKGATRKDAAESAGVDYRTFLNWIQRGDEKKRGLYFQFFRAVTMAEAEIRVKFTTTLALAAASGDWRAAESYLKRRDPTNWGDRSKVDLNVSDADITAAIEQELARVAGRSQTAHVDDAESEIDSA